MTAIGFMGVVVVSAAYLLSGTGIAFSAFFLIPIGFATWYAGRRAGILIAVLSAAAWLSADLRHAASLPSFPLLNALLRLAVFLFVAFLLDALERSHYSLQEKLSALQNEAARRTDAQRRVAEQDVEQQIILDSVPALIFYKDSENRMLRVNRAFADALGTTRERIEGKSCSELWPETAEDYWRDDREVMRSGEPKRRILEPMRSPRGLLWLETDKIPFRDRDGKIAGIIGFALDITRRKEAEEQLRHAQKMDAIGNLAGALAHDFNNILAGIVGYAHLLREQLGPQSSARADIAAIEKLGKRGTDLTRSLLSFARKSEYHPKPFDVRRVIRDVVDLLRQTAGRSVSMRVDAQEGMRNVLGDEGQLQQLFMNLCLNACDAMPEGGKLTVRAENALPGDNFFSLHPELRKGPYVSVSVSDTGVGITPEVLQRIYEPFFTTKPERRGTGLGLAIVSGIVGMHGGSIGVESSPGRGTTFTVLLPATAEREEGDAQEEALAPRGNETVLLIDDEEAIRDGIGRWLKGLGYTVLAAENGEEALNLLRKSGGSVDLVLLDIVMKGIGGEETFRRMRARFPGLPVLILTGYAPGEVAQRLIAEGASGLVGKPVDYALLAGKIRETLGAAGD